MLHHNSIHCLDDESLLYEPSLYRVTSARPRERRPRPFIPHSPELLPSRSTPLLRDDFNYAWEYYDVHRDVRRFRRARHTRPRSYDGQRQRFGPAEWLTDGVYYDANFPAIDRQPKLRRRSLPSITHESHNCYHRERPVRRDSPCSCRPPITRPTPRTYSCPRCKTSSPMQRPLPLHRSPVEKKKPVSLSNSKRIDESKYEKRKTNEEQKEEDEEPKRVQRKPVSIATSDLVRLSDSLQNIRLEDNRRAQTKNRKLLLRSPLSISPSSTNSSSLFDAQVVSSPGSSSESSSLTVSSSKPSISATFRGERPSNERHHHQLSRVQTARPCIYREPGGGKDQLESSDDEREEEEEMGMVIPTFWNPRMGGGDASAPLRRNLSRKLRGLLQPQRSRLAGASRNEHIADRIWSVERTMTPEAQTGSSPSGVLEDTVPVGEQLTLEFEEQDFVQIDTYAANVNQRGPMLTPALLAQKFLTRPYRRELFRIRSIFVWLMHNIAIKDVGVKNESTDKVLADRSVATPLGLASLLVEMAVAAGFTDAHLVHGYLRDIHDSLEAVLCSEDTLVQNHVWAAIKVEGEYRFIDCWLASPYYPENGGKMEPHWFLCRPQDLIYTHFPSNPCDQYLEPPIDIDTFFAFPCVCPSFFRYHMRILQYSPDDCNPGDDQIFHVTLQVDPDIAFYAEVETSTHVGGTCRTITTRKRGLAQCAHVPGYPEFRLCKVKAVMPSDQTVGWLKIYAGPRIVNQISVLSGTTNYNSAAPAHQQPQEKPGSLALCFRLTQEHPRPSTRPFDFVQLHLNHYEFYIQEPQCYQLYPLQLYNFCIKSDQSHHKLAIRAPSGRLYKLTYYPHDHTYEGSLTVSEVGQWSLISLLHNAGGWYTVASWECKS